MEDHIRHLDAQEWESVAGVTVHVMTEKIDAGDIVAQQELMIGERREMPGN